MKTKKPGFGDVSFSGRKVNSRLDSDCYESASGIADDLKSSLLAELQLTDEIGTWERDLSLLSDYGWVKDCERIARELVRVRETTPLDIVAVGGLTDGVHLRPLLASLSLVMRALLQRVVMVDCNLRNPSLHTITASSAKEGFIDMIKYGCSFFTSATETEMGGIYVISAGSHPVSSEEELMGRELEWVFHSLRAKADITFVLLQPFLAEGRINPILEHMDGVLLCVNRMGNRKDVIARDFARLWQSDIPVIGIVSQEPIESEAREAVLSRSVSKEVRDSQEPVESIVSDIEPVRGEDKERIGDGGTAADEGEREDEGAGPFAQESFGGSPRDEESESQEESLKEEADIVETTLFGKRTRRRRLPLIVGICVAAVIIGGLWVREAGFFVPEGPELDGRTTRSIVLPGSDGITNATEDSDEVPGLVTGEATGSVEDAGQGLAEAPVSERGSEEVGELKMEGEREVVEMIPEKATAQPSGEEKGDLGDTQASATSGMLLVHASSFRRYQNAAKDSSRIAATGLKTSIVLVEFEDLGNWYRVVVGPFEGHKDAEAAASKLISLGLVRNVRIISEGGSE